MLKKIITIILIGIFTLMVSSCFGISWGTDPETPDIKEDNLTQLKADAFRKNASNILVLTPDVITIDYRIAVENALNVFKELSPEIQELLEDEYEVLRGLLVEIIYQESNKQIQVQFKNLEGQIIEQQSVTRGQFLSAPQTPFRKSYIFLGWSISQNYLEKFCFVTTPILEELTLYAHFTFSYNEAMYLINTKMIRANIRMIRYNYDQTTGVFQSSTAASGVIFKITDNPESNSRTYWVMSNWHVVREYRNYVRHAIIDYRGTRTPATAVYGSRAYDIAIVRFTRYGEEQSRLHYIEKALENIPAGSRIINMSQPDWQWNAIYFGRVNAYITASVQGGVAAGLYVMNHTVRTQGGSSGSPILCTNFRLVGIHFATRLAVPISYIHRFLDTFLWDYIREFQDSAHLK